MRWPMAMCRYLDRHRWHTVTAFYGGPAQKVRPCVNRDRGCIAERSKG